MTNHKTVLITGASSGIGRRTAGVLAQRAIRSSEPLAILSTARPFQRAWSFFRWMSLSTLLSRRA